jgi:serine protease
MSITFRSFRISFGTSVSLALTTSLLGILPSALAAERGPALRAASAPAVDSEARVIVKFRADSSLMHALSATTGQMLPQHAQTLGTRLGLALTDGRVVGPRVQVMKGKGLTSRELAERLSAQSDVEYAAIDGRVHAFAMPNDPLYPAAATASPVVGQWYLRAPASSTIQNATSVVSAVNAEAAWGITTGSPTVVVADLDTGIRADHPDFAGKILPGYDFVKDVATANDGNGIDNDPSDPGDGGTCNGTAEASTWHGTQTAGLIGAATNNGVGMASVGYNVMLLPVRVLGVCGGFDSDIQAGMLWAGGISSTPVVNAHPAKVINLSLGATGACSAAYTDVVAQLNAKGVVIVAAGGNEGLAVGTPANCAGVIGVAGVRHAGTKVGYSDLGPQIAIAAPAGNCVNTTSSAPCLFPLLTTSNTGTQAPVLGAAGAKYTGSGADASLGTSFSAPLVSGTVALMFSVNPGLSASQVLTALKLTARAFPASGSSAGVTACVDPATAPAAQNAECYCTTSTCGAGLLDTGAAVASVALAVANISVPSSAATVGASVTLDASSSRGSGGSNTVSSYAWTITTGSDIAAFTSAANAATVTLLPSAAGTVVVSLTITDSAGNSATSSTTLNVTAAGVVAPMTPATTTSSSGDSGGGGAMSPAWLAAWLLMVAAVWAVTPRRRA